MRLRLVALALLGASLVGPSSASGASPEWFEGPFETDPETLRQVADAAAADSDSSAIVLSQSFEWSFDTDHRVTRRFYQLVLLRDNAAASSHSWKTLSITRYPWYQDRPSFRARVLTPEGDILSLDLDTLVESPADPEANLDADRRIRFEAPLPGIRAGSVIETEIVSRDHRALFPGRRYSTWADAPAWAEAELVHGQIVVSAPTDLPLRWDLAASPGTIEETVSDGERRLVYTVVERPVYELAEPGAPIEASSEPWLSFSTGESWQAIAAEYARRIDQALEDADFAEAIASVASESDRRRRAGLLFRAVRQPVETPILDLFAAALEPIPPAEVLARGWGTPIDIATLVLGALRADGFDADLALFLARPEGELPAQLPGLGGFGDLVLRLRLDDETLWFHPSVPWRAIDILAGSAYGRQALILSPDTTDLVTLPTPSPQTNRRVLDREIRLASFGAPAFAERLEAHGIYAAPERTALELFGVDAIEQMRTERALARHGAEAAPSVTIEGAEEAEGPVVYHLTGESSELFGNSHLGAAGGILRYSEVLALVIDGLALDEDTPREQPFEWRPRQIFEFRNRFVGPPGFELATLPDDRDVELGVLRLSETYRLLAAESSDTGPTVESLWTLDSGAQRLSAEEFENTRQALRRELQRANPTIVFQPVAVRQMAEGKAAQALAGYRQRLAANPDDATEHIRQSITLLDLGLVDAARRVAREAVELAPEDPYTHWALGGSLMRDSIGRQYYPGYDRPGALAALEKAVELAPDNYELSRELATLQMRDEDGNYFGPGVDLEEVLDGLREWHERFGDEHDELEAHLQFGLFRAERWQELRDATENPRDPRAQTYALAATAMIDGAEATVRQAEGLGLGTDNHNRILLGVAQSLFGFRYYEQAAELLRISSVNSPSPAQLGMQAEEWAGIERIDALRPLDDSPEGLVRHLIQLCDPDLGGDLESSFTPYFPAGMESEILERLHENWTGYYCQLYAHDPDGQLSRQKLESLLSTLEFETEGRPEDLKRVLVKLPGPGGSPFGEFYTLREDGAWKLAGFPFTARPAARLALFRLEAGDTAAARQLLDWERGRRSPRDTQDPFAVHPLVSLWTVGQEADPETLRIALAGLLTSSDVDQELGLEIFTAALDHTSDPDLQRVYEVGRMKVLRYLQRHDELASLARRLHETAPDSDQVLGHLLYALRRSERWSEAEALIARRLETQPDDRFALSERFTLFNTSDDPRLPEAIEALEAASGNDLRGSTLNILGWSLLFHLGDDPEVTLERSLRLSQQAVQKSEYEDPAHLHTLATIYGFLDRPVDAYRVLVQALEARDGGTLEEEDWLVLGLVAESCGEISSARDFYRRLTKPEEPTSRSSWRLAQQRLEQLGPEPERKKRRKQRRERRRRQAADGFPTNPNQPR